jgi:hypothetical protein
MKAVHYTARDNTRAFRPARTRRGAALITAILCLAVVGIIAATTMRLSFPYSRQADDRLRTARALQLAEAGAAHVLALRRGLLSTTSVNQLLTGHDAIAGNADDGLLTGLGLPVAAQIPSSGVSMTTGRYTVRLLDDLADPAPGATVDGNGLLLARCRGETSDGGVAEIDVVIGGAASGPAILFNAPAKLSGSATVNGACGGIHANGNLLLSGGASATGIVSSTGTASGGKKGVTRQSNAPAITVPSVTMASQCRSGDLILNANGTAQLGAQTLTATSTERWGWKRSSSSPVKWEFDPKKGSPAAIPNTAVCVNGNVYISGNVTNTGNTSYPISIFATGSIELSGNSKITAVSGRDYSLLAEGDVSLSGNSSIIGTVYARAHCKGSGNGSIVGQLICLSEPDGPGDIDLIDENDISGNGSVTFNCQGAGGGGTPRIMQWAQRF